VEDVAGLGVNLLLVEYRGYGGSTGSPQLGKMIDDVSVVRQACGLAPQDTFLYGRSVGAIFAVEWASQQPDIAGLILESGVANPHQRLAIRLDPEELGVDPATFAAACAERLDHRAKLAAYSGPLLVFHAAGDSLVGVDHAHSHMEWAASSEKQLVLFPRGDHNTIMTYNWSQMRAHMREFFQR
jgi:pimeloyl-ACP methyl ester carboxylesterase